MKRLFFIITLFFATNSIAQDKPFNIYDINIDPFEQIAKAQVQAKAESKNIFIQAGGNWCKWCRYFHKFSNENQTIDSILKADYVVIHVNYSKENKNEKFFNKYNNAGRFGYPVFLVLNEDAELLHIQDSGYLEEGQGYSEEKVSRFLVLWNRKSTIKK